MNIRVLEQQNQTDLQRDFAESVCQGLSSIPKSIPSVYLYDSIGSHLFKEITNIPEYYLTNCEYEILDNYKEEIAELLVKEERFRLIDLGAGDGRKTSILLDYFCRLGLDFEYIPIDVSKSAVSELIKTVHSSYPETETLGLVCDYFEGLNFLKADGVCDMVLFLGSSIGNFTLEEAKRFCQAIGNIMKPGDYFLLGMDLIKEPSTLLQAYNDPAGLTARFNLNLLQRINRELEGNFSADKFQYYTTYDALHNTMRSSLLSREEQWVRIDHLDREFYFHSWEALHTECSWKYNFSDAEYFAHSSNFSIAKLFTDSQNFFLDAIFRRED